MLFGAEDPKPNSRLPETVVVEFRGLLLELAPPNSPPPEAAALVVGVGKSLAKTLNLELEAVMPAGLLLLLLRAGELKATLPFAADGAKGLPVGWASPNPTPFEAGIAELAGLLRKPPLWGPLPEAAVPAAGVGGVAFAAIPVITVFRLPPRVLFDLGVVRFPAPAEGVGPDPVVEDGLALGPGSALGGFAKADVSVAPPAMCL